MIIREIVFHHFLVYHGDQGVKLPATGKSALTVVVGPNNSGKTSFIRGLKFWLYGENGVSKKSDLPLLLNNRAKAQVNVGGTLEAWVQVTFERQTIEGTETVTLRRTMEGRRRGPETWEVDSVSLRQIMTGARPQNDSKTAERWQARLEGMMPKALYDAFYFKGEPLDGKLLADVTGIRAALGLFLHEDQWKEAETAAAAIRDDLGKQIAALSAKNRELSDRIKDQSRIQAQLDDQRAALEEEVKKRDSLEAKIEEETENLTKLGDEAAAQDAKIKLARAKQTESEANQVLATAESSIIREIGNSLGLPFLVGAVPAVREILSGMERDNILPADISEGFIDRVLERKSCICGRDHDGDSRDAWEAYRAKTLAADVNEGLRKLLDWVRPDGERSILQRSARTCAQLTQSVAARSKAVATANEARSHLDRAEKALAQVPHEEIARIGRALQQLRGDIGNCEKRVLLFEKEVGQREGTLKRLKEEIAELRKKSGINTDAFEKLETAKERADGLHRLLGMCRNRLGTYFHRVLQSAVTKAYDSKATDGSRARIDKSTLLPSIHVSGEKTGHLGGGQSQLLALAYVVALARLRQDMHSQLETLGVRLGKIDDLSFFMDSPFGNMEEHYKKASVELIPGSARQVVVLLWKEDWVFARPVLEPLAAAIHAVKFNTTLENLEKIRPEERLYPLPGEDRELLVPLPQGEEHPRSELIKIR